MSQIRIICLIFGIACTGESDTSITVDREPGIVVVQPEMLNFGEQEFQTSTSLSLTLSNRGTGTLQLYDFDFIDNAQRPHWNVDGGLSGFLEPEQEISVQVTANPQSLDNPSTGLRIRSDDPERQEITVPLQIEVYALPEIRVAPPEVLDLGPVEVNTQETADVVIGNGGYANLSITNVSLQDPDMLDFSIDIDASGTTIRSRTDDGLIRIRFAPTEIGTFTQTLLIESDDPQHGAWSILISGTGV